VKEITESSAPAAFCAGVSRGFISPIEDGISIRLSVSPGAKRTSIEGSYGENSIKHRVAAPATGRKASAEVERFLAEILGTSPSDIILVRGAASRDKIVRVYCRAQGETWKLLSAYLH
jgi:uncharacterized protein (TIGR00251 family)